jgi:HEAT repeat protein
MDEENYTPSSDFVWMAAHDEVPLAGSAQADANLSLLIRFTKDPDKSNRDWATMALGMYGPDTDVTTAALLAAANDADADVRAEAIHALAKRDPKSAMPLIKRDLQREPCGYGVFIAAGLLADRGLVDLLRRFDFDTASPWIDRDVRAAIAACESETPVEAWRV